MRYIKNYDLYKKFDSLNEEFIGKSIKGALSKVFGAFTAPFKDLSDDIKKSFKPDDPNSIKRIIMTNLNQAVDGAQKLIRDPNIKDGDIGNIMSTFISSLTDLSNGIDKDFDGAIAKKPEASGAKSIAKTIIMGSKAMKIDINPEWKGIVGLLGDPNYKYSNQKYQSSLTAAAEKKNPNVALKAKQDAASAFFDNFQRDITTQIDKILTEEEMTKIYNDAKKAGGGSTQPVFTYDQLKVFYDKKTPVRYKMNGYDEIKKPEEQEDGVIGLKVMDTLDDQGNVGFKGADGVTTFKKKYSDILGPKKEGEGGNNAKELAADLGRIKNDEEKMKKVDTYAKFIQNAPTDKIAEVDALINPKPTNEQ